MGNDSGTRITRHLSPVASCACCIVRVNDDETSAGEVGVDIYNLVKYQRSNQNTNINQRPLVKVGNRISRGDVVAFTPGGMASTREWIQIDRADAADYGKDLELFQASLDFVKAGRR